MPINIRVESDSPVCTTHVWEVVDQGKLDELIAHLTLAFADHALSILRSLNQQSPFVAQGLVDDALSLLDPGDKPWQRDGWVFQLISWLGARLEFPGAVAAPPHPQWSEKGLDGFFLERTGDEIAYITLSEDKASENPRRMIRKSVWPDFESFEAGRNMNKVIPWATVLIKEVGLTPEAVFSNPNWYGERRYRVAINAATATSTAEKRKKLFKDFESTVPGDQSRRYGALLLNDDIRKYLSDTAERVKLLLPGMVT